MNTKDIYQPIYAEMKDRNIRILREQGVRPDTVLNEPEDPRRGIALFVFGEFSLTPSFAQAQEEAASLFKNQSVYSLHHAASYDEALLHFTLFQFYGVGDIDERFQTGDLERYHGVLSGIFAKIPSFTISYSGLIAVPSGLVMYGYPSLDVNGIRESIRKEFTRNSIPFREPYKNDIVHSTFVRLRNPMDAAPLISFAEDYRETDLGSLAVSRIELCYGSWRMRQDEIIRIRQYGLGG